MDRTLQACRTLRSSALGLIKSGLHPSVISIDTCNRIVRQVCFTKAFFGCELWTEITTTEILLLERAQRYVCKSIQGLPRQTRSDMVNALIRWKSAESYIDERKLLFLDCQCSNRETTPAFTSVLTNAQCVSRNVAITFDRVVVNIKDGYDTTTVICQGTETVLDLFPEYKIGQRRIDALENDNKALKVEIAQIKADGGPAFTVSLTTREPTISGNVPIKFNNVILNRRSGYDPSTGYFTVPLTGLYQISATIMSRNNDPFHASLNKNGHDIVLLYGTEINGANESANVVVELTKGDKVCVKHRSGTEVIHGYGYCYFSGYYISK
ncbi:Hypothetical predicted protein [Mytilus galloprovincialis]|uniref:C1q domain-containing protein n=1 Tax=Mytilus galloprovincialis TaxID=29158 RepID=A0A8B6F104_MYTGA|nr:Hypothetical predicted protein [Mytilus galloprovincialis]